MSTNIAQQIGQITDNRNTLRNVGEDLGITLATDNLQQIAEKFSEIINHGTVQAQVKEGETFTIQEGYYEGGTVAGMGTGGNYDLQARTVTPTKSQQVVTPDESYFGLSSVTVNPIPNQFQDVSGVTATAAQVLAGALIVNTQGETVAGTMTDHGAANIPLNGMVTTSAAIPAGFHDGLGAVSLTNDIELALAAI